MSHDETLPLPDYDHLPDGSIQHRIRSLRSDQLQQLLDYERKHNDRIQVVEMLRERMNELDRGELPSPGRQDDDPVEAQGRHGGSPVDPSGSPQPIHPPPEGAVGQEGKPKGNRARKSD